MVFGTAKPKAPSQQSEIVERGASLSPQVAQKLIGDSIRLPSIHNVTFCERGKAENNTHFVRLMSMRRNEKKERHVKRTSTSVHWSSCKKQAWGRSTTCQSWRLSGDTKGSVVQTKLSRSRPVEGYRCLGWLSAPIGIALASGMGRMTGVAGTAGLGCGTRSLPPIQSSYTLTAIFPTCLAPELRSGQGSLRFLRKRALRSTSPS